MNVKYFIISVVCFFFIGHVEAASQKLNSFQKKIVKEALITADAKRQKVIYSKYGNVPAVVTSLCKNKRISKKLSIEIAKQALIQGDSFIDSIGRFRSYRLALASNKGADPEALLTLSKIGRSKNSYYSFLHKSLAGNRSTPYEVLKELSQFYDYAEDLAGNTSLKKNDLIKLYNDIEKLPLTTNNKRLSNSGIRIIKKFLKNKTLPISIAQKIYLESYNLSNWWIVLQSEQQKDVSVFVKDIQKLAMNSNKISCKWLKMQTSKSADITKDYKNYCLNKSSK